LGHRGQDPRHRLHRGDRQMKSLAILLMLATPAWASITFTKSVQGGQTTMYVGGTIGFDINLGITGIETNVVIHDPTPAGFTLLGVQHGGNTIDCTTSAGGTFPS